MKIGWWQAGLHFEPETDEDYTRLCEFQQVQAAEAFPDAIPLWDLERLREQGRETMRLIKEHGLEGVMAYAGPSDGRDEKEAS